MITDIIHNNNTGSDALGTAIYKNIYYDFQVYIVNPNFNNFILRNSAIRELYLDDNINNYYHQGYIIVDNDYDLLERSSAVEVTNKGIFAETPERRKEGYLFRGDARDFLKISISPRQIPQSSVKITEKDKELFALDFTFAIYNIEEIQGEDASKKYKKLYFWDVYHQLMLEKNVHFATADLVKTSTNATDSQRSIKTGKAIFELLKTTFPKSENFDIQFGKFEEGETSIFFSAPVDFKAEDSLNYLMVRHVSTKANNFDKSILRIERYPKRWSLVSMKEYFDEAYVPGKDDAGGKLFLEKFILGGYKSSDRKIADAVISRSPKYVPFFGESNIIDNFTFIPTPGEITQQHVNTTLVHTYSYRQKSFFIDTAKNSFEDIQKVYKENYVENMKGHNNVPVSNLLGNEYRFNNMNVRNVYSTSEEDKDQRLGVGRSQILRNAVMLNNSISFKVPGATYRQAGRFMSIDRSDSIPDERFDDKLLGIYFIVDVKHIFTESDYVNEVTAVKTYNYKSTNETEDVL